MRTTEPDRDATCWPTMGSTWCRLHHGPAALRHRYRGGHGHDRGVGQRQCPSPSRCWSLRQLIDELSWVPRGARESHGDGVHSFLKDGRADQIQDPGRIAARAKEVTIRCAVTIAYSRWTIYDLFPAHRNRRHDFGPAWGWLLVPYCLYATGDGLLWLCC